MNKLVLILGFTVLWPFTASLGQIAAPNEAGVAMSHLHMNVRDVEANKRFWTALGGTAMKFDDQDVIKFPNVLIFLRPKAPTGGSVGEVVDHVGFQVPDVQASFAKWKAAGLKVEAASRPTQCWLYSPDDMRVEILEDKALTSPIVTHHLQWAVKESTMPEIQAWYAKMFGAKPGKRGDNLIADVPGMSLTFGKFPDSTKPTLGRALDHIGFEVKNLEAFCKKLEANGVKFDKPYTLDTGGRHPGLAGAELTDPWGTYIELNEGLDKL